MDKVCEWDRCENLSSKRFCRQACRDKWKYHNDPEWRAKKLAKNTKYNQENPEVGSAAQKKWYENGGAEVREAYRKANWERQLELQREWRRTENGMASNVIHCNKRRKRILESPGQFTVEEWLELCRKFEGKCARCGKLEQHADHVMPLSLGGSNTIDNIQPLCRSCNSSKGATYVDYR